MSMNKHTIRFKDPQNLVTCNESDLRYAMRVAEDDADLGWGETLASEFYNMINDIIWRRLEPCRGSASVWQGRGRCGKLSEYWS